MKLLISMTVCFLAISAHHTNAGERQIPNHAIDYEGFLEDAGKAGQLRQQRRISEDEFIRMMEDPGTVILDARSTEKFRRLHVKGAKHLSLPDMTAPELARIIPEKGTRILIYCNNNFEKEERAFPTKAFKAALNIFTFNSLHSYGYRNVYELGPLLDINQSKIPFEGESRK